TPLAATRAQPVFVPTSLCFLPWCSDAITRRSLGFSARWSVRNYPSERIVATMSTPALHETAAKSFDIAWVRDQSPPLQLQVNGQPAAFLDGPAGTQVPRQVTDAVQKYFLEANANTYGAFLTSRRANEVISNARSAMADLFNCAPEEVVFGQNMTTITLGLSRAIGRELQPGDEILLTTLDHDANFSPWAALAEKGVIIRKVDIRESDCTLDLDDLKSKLNSKTKIVAGSS